MRLVTGAAGFIGYSLCRLLGPKNIIAADLFPVPDSIRAIRWKKLTDDGFICSSAPIPVLVDTYRPSTVFHMAAQPGVMQSIVDPHTTEDRNISLFIDVLESCKETGSKLIYASSSTVNAGMPISWYGLTKHTMERMADLPQWEEVQSVGLRLHTVYGPWGRPDMGIWKFTRALMNGETIYLYNRGWNSRDITYVYDVVRAIEKTEAINSGVFDVGAGNPITMEDLVYKLADILEVEPRIVLDKTVMGDMISTGAYPDPFMRATGWKPLYSTDEGLRLWVEWYKLYRNRYGD